MTPSAFQPYGQLVTELVQQALSSDSALRAAVAARRIRNRMVNKLYARMPETGPAARQAEWIRHALTREADHKKR
jgi:hypothetical protein